MLDNGWKEVLLEQVAEELTVGYVGTMASEYVPNGIPFLRSQNVEQLQINLNDIKYITPQFHNQIKKSALKPGDVVIVRTGKPGACAVIPDWLPVSNCSDLVIVRCGPGLDSRFLAYYINSQSTHHISAHLVGAVQQHFNVASARKIKLYLPDINEQHAIANVLGSLDDKIELNQRMNETLEQLARALFQSWFVDFDPVRAKAEGRVPAGMDAETAALFPSAFDGDVPEGWKVTSLGNVVNVLDARRIPLSGREREKRRGQYPYYGAASVMDYVDSYLFDGIYVLMGEDGSVVDDNEHPVTQYVWGKFWVNNHAHVLQGKGISTEHLLLFLQQINIRPYVTGAVQPKLNQGNMGQVPFLLPGTNICKLFDETIAPLYVKYRANIEESRTLAELRDTLLPRLMSGEIRVKDAV